MREEENGCAQYRVAVKQQYVGEERAHGPSQTTQVPRSGLTKDAERFRFAATRLILLIR